MGYSRASSPSKTAIPRRRAGDRRSSTQPRRLPVDRLTVDDRYQRGEITTHVNRIAREYREELIGVLEVSQRNNGVSYAVLDGCQRRGAVIKRGHPTALRCNVHEGLTLAEEAALYVWFNRHRKQVSALDRFKAALVAGELSEEGAQARAIYKVCEKNGWEVGRARKTMPYRIAAVTQLQLIHTRGGDELLDSTLELLRMWQGDLGCTDGTFIRGVSKLLSRVELTPRQREKLGKEGPVVYMRQAKALVVTHSMGGGESFANAVSQALEAQLKRRKSS